MDGPVRAYPVRRRRGHGRPAASAARSGAAYPARRRPPRPIRKLGSARVLVGGLVGLLILVFALSSIVVADTVVRFRVQGQIAAAMDEVLTCAPKVRVRGLSAIWQVRQQHFKDVRVRCDQATVTPSDGDDITLKDLRLDGRDIRAGADINDAVLGEATISALLPYDQASTLLGSKVSSGGPGRIAVTRTVEVSGVAVPVTVSAVLGVSDGKLVLSDPRAEAIGVSIPPVVVNQLSAQIVNHATLPTLGTMTVSSIVPLDEGLMFTLHGTEVALSELQ